MTDGLALPHEQPELETAYSNSSTPQRRRLWRGRLLHQPSDSQMRSQAAEDRVTGKHIGDDRNRGNVITRLEPR